ncbi:hypothetical protein BGZ94_004853 [Podila epigama]|nr:hypothetical protein BGZ94_004853 [Podila epigama]
MAALSMLWKAYVTRSAPVMNMDWNRAICRQLPLQLQKSIFAQSPASTRRVLARFASSDATNPGPSFLTKPLVYSRPPPALVPLAPCPKSSQANLRAIVVYLKSRDKHKRKPRKPTTPTTTNLAKERSPKFVKNLQSVRSPKHEPNHSTSQSEHDRIREPHHLHQTKPSSQPQLNSWSIPDPQPSYKSRPKFSSIPLTKVPSQPISKSPPNPDPQPLYKSQPKLLSQPLSSVLSSPPPKSPPNPDPQPLYKSQPKLLSQSLSSVLSSPPPKSPPNPELQAPCKPQPKVYSKPLAKLASKPLPKLQSRKGKGRIGRIALHHHRHQDNMSRQGQGRGTRNQPTARVTTQSTNDTETISESVQILCDAMIEAKVYRARQYPPVFLTATYEKAEVAMQIFTDYYKTVYGSIGPVGFDTETSSPFVQRTEKGVSLLQIATDDVCLMFQLFRITKKSTRMDLFPPRLKAFLEDENQILAGVAASGDAALLRQLYNVDCKGVVNLDQMAAERNILARSLADLDNMFGRPGREVVKTKAMLKWQWDASRLDPTWIWYAAKDAFAGHAIYVNMSAERLKEGYIPYERQFPMTDEQQADDAADFLLRCFGQGVTSSLHTIRTLLTNGYPRFLKIYQPKERAAPVQKIIQQLNENGFLTIQPNTSTHIDVNKIGGSDNEIGVSNSRNDNRQVKLRGVSFSTSILTPAAVDYLGKHYFSGQTVDLHAIQTDTDIPSETPEHIQGDGDAEIEQGHEEDDMTMFVKYAHFFDRPHKMSALTSMYVEGLVTDEIRKANKQKAMEATQNDADILPSISTETLTTMDEGKEKDGIVTEEGATTTTVATVEQYPPKPDIDRAKAVSTWQRFVHRLKYRGVLDVEGRFVSVRPTLVQKLAALYEKQSSNDQTPSARGNKDDGQPENNMLAASTLNLA